MRFQHLRRRVAAAVGWWTVPRDAEQGVRMGTWCPLSTGWASGVLLDPYRVVPRPRAHYYIAGDVQTKI